MKVLRDTGLLFRRKMMETLRNPIYIIISLLSPILYLVLFSPLLKKLTNTPVFSSSDVMEVFVPGSRIVAMSFCEPRSW